MKMLTLFGKNIKDMSYNELAREKHVQSVLLTQVRNTAEKTRKALDSKERHTETYFRMKEDKALFYEMYVQHLEALIAEIDYWLDRRFEPAENAYWRKPRSVIREQNAVRRKRRIADNTLVYDTTHSTDGFTVSWDRDKFMLIAADRGYQTEEIVIAAVAKALRLERGKARTLIDLGRFTWGQVLVLGGYFEMTPKEFCDTFLAGYFTEQYGEYRADYDNLNTVELLKRAIKGDPTYGMDTVEVGADGKPLDRE